MLTLLLEMQLKKTRRQRRERRGGEQSLKRRSQKARRGIYAYTLLGHDEAETGVMP